MLDEREPGVYVRTEQPADELDFFWDKDHKKSRTQQPFHVSIFLAGFAAGAIFTFFLCLLFFSGGKLFGVEDKVGKNNVIIEQDVLSPNDIDGATAAAPATDAEAPPEPAPKEAPKAEAPNRFKSFFAGHNDDETKASDTTQTNASEVANVQSYEVKDGDTLGGIAYKFYQSSGPNAVDKILKANNLKNAESLQIGQKLVIPPKS